MSVGLVENLDALFDKPLTAAGFVGCCCDHRLHAGWGRCANGHNVIWALFSSTRDRGGDRPISARTCAATADPRLARLPAASVLRVFRGLPRCAPADGRTRLAAGHVAQRRMRRGGVFGQRGWYVVRITCWCSLAARGDAAKAPARCRIGTRRRHVRRGLDDYARPCGGRP